MNKSWIAQRRGAILCAPACGRGCTVAAHDLAVARAAALCAGLGPGWKPRVWENLGWHYSVTSACGRWKIHPHHYEATVTFTAFLGDTGGSGGFWAESGNTPQAAMRKTWRVAKPQIERWKSFENAGEAVP